MKKILLFAVLSSFLLAAAAFSQMGGMKDTPKKSPAKTKKMEMKEGEVCSFERCMTDEMCMKDDCADTTNKVCRFDICTDMKDFVFGRKPVLGLNSAWGLFTKEEHMMMMPKMKEKTMGAKTTHHIACYLVDPASKKVITDAAITATLFDLKGMRVGRSGKPLTPMSGHYGEDFNLRKGSYKLEATVKRNGREEKIDLSFKVS